MAGHALGHRVAEGALFYQTEALIPTPGGALHMATLGAAEALGKGAVIGSFEIGKEADVTVMDYGALLPYRQTAKPVNDLSAEDLTSLCIHRGGRTRCWRPSSAARAFSARRSLSCFRRLPKHSSRRVTRGRSPARGGSH